MARQAVAHACAFSHPVARAADRQPSWPQARGNKAAQRRRQRKAPASGRHACGLALAAALLKLEEAALPPDPLEKGGGG
eukprot:3888956-Alexandrium_andersonii.AAC.2